MMQRRIIQILGVGPSGDELIALCDDSTIWAQASKGWQKLEPIPGTDVDGEFAEVEPAPLATDSNWPPQFLWAPSSRLFAWKDGNLTELTDANGLVLAVRTECTIAEADNGVQVLEGARHDFKHWRKENAEHCGIQFSYWSDTIPF